MFTELNPFLNGRFLATQQNNIVKIKLPHSNITIFPFLLIIFTLIINSTGNLLITTSNYKLISFLMETKMPVPGTSL